MTWSRRWRCFAGRRPLARSGSRLGCFAVHDKLDEELDAGPPGPIREASREELELALLRMYRIASELSLALRVIEPENPAHARLAAADRWLYRVGLHRRYW